MVKEVFWSLGETRNGVTGVLPVQPYMFEALGRQRQHEVRLGWRWLRRLVMFRMEMVSVREFLWEGYFEDCSSRRMKKAKFRRVNPAHSYVLQGPFPRRSDDLPTDIGFRGPAAARTVACPSPLPSLCRKTSCLCNVVENLTNDCPNPG